MPHIPCNHTLKEAFLQSGAVTQQGLETHLVYPDPACSKDLPHHEDRHGDHLLDALGLPETCIRKNMAQLEAWLHRNICVWASVLHSALWHSWDLGFHSPHSCMTLHAHMPLLAEVPQMIYVGIFLGKGKHKRCDNTGAHGTGTHETLLTCISWGSARPLQALWHCQNLLCVGCERPEPLRGNEGVPLPFILFTFYWCQLLGYGYAGGEKAERHNYHLVNCVGCLISPWMSLLISVLFNHPGTQGFPRESFFPSQWKGK